MTYNNQFYPATYPQMYPQAQYNPVYQQNSQPASNNTINWVQGESAARSFIVSPSQSVLLMDSDDSVFYIKSADASGMPLPLRIFDYKERTPQQHTEPQIQQNSPEYITREEFEKRLSEISEPRRNANTRKERNE